MSWFGFGEEEEDPNRKRLVVERKNYQTLTKNVPITNGRQIIHSLRGKRYH
jgi:hypothetical protein